MPCDITLSGGISAPHRGTLYQCEYGAEIKFSFSAEQATAAAESFGLRPHRAEQLEIHFLDTLNPDGPWLLGLGVVLRLRGRVEENGDSTLKLRPAQKDRLTGRWLPENNHDKDYRVEYDWARQPVLSASQGAKITSDRLAAVLSGARPLKHAFTERQQKFLRDCGPDLDSPFRRLRIAGPIAALRWSGIEAAGSDDLRAERWTWGNGNTFLELSLRVDNYAQAEDRRARLAADLQHRELKADSGATTKTETVLRDLLGG